MIWRIFFIKFLLICIIFWFHDFFSILNNANLGTSGDNKETVEELLDVLEAKKTEIQQIMPTANNNFKKDSKSQKLNKKSYFGLSISAEIQSRDKSAEDLELLVNSKKSTTTNTDFQDHPHLALFCDQENVLQDLIG